MSEGRPYMVRTGGIDHREDWTAHHPPGQVCAFGSCGKRKGKMARQRILVEVDQGVDTPSNLDDLVYPYVWEPMAAT